MKLKQVTKRLSAIIVTVAMSMSLMLVENVYADEAQVTDKASVQIKYSNSVDKVYLSEEDNVTVSQVFLKSLNMEISDKTQLSKYAEVEIIDDDTTFSIDYDNSSISKENIGETYIFTYMWYKNSEGKTDAQTCFVGGDINYQYCYAKYEKVDENIYKITDDGFGGLMIIGTFYNDNSTHWTYAITKSDYEKYEKDEIFDFLTEEEIKDDSDKIEADSYEITLTSDNSSISGETFNTILSENATKDVAIKTADGITFTFAKGTMKAVDGVDKYDFSASVSSDYSKHTDMPNVSENNFVALINYNYSGKLPAEASIKIPVGASYAGQTLYYSQYMQDKSYALVQSVVADAEGYITIKQDHCSTYVVTTEELKTIAEEPATDSSSDVKEPATDNSSNVETPPTGDSSNYIVYVILACCALGAIAIVGKRKFA